MQSQPSQSPAVCGCPWLLSFPLLWSLTRFLHSLSMAQEGHGMPAVSKNPASFQGRLQAYGFFHKPSAGRGWNLLPGSPWLQEVQTPFLHQGDELGPATLPCGPRQVTLAGLSLPILKLGTIGTSPGGPVGFPGGTTCKEPTFDPWVGKMPWRRVWQPTLVPSPGESHGQRRLAAYGPWG